MSREHHALILSANDAYARALAVAAWSALVHLSEEAELAIHVLDHGFTNTSRERLTRVVRAAGRDTELRWLTVPADRVDFGDERFTGASYARLLIPELLPTDVERAVYLDCDVLVRNDISPLFTAPIGEAEVAWVRDVAIPSTTDEHSGVREPSQARPYFNAGVLVMNLAQWRRTGLGDRALAYCAASEQALPWADQDALNALVERWHELDYRWNFQHPRLFRDPPPPECDPRAAIYERRQELFRDAAVLHFTGQKPWYGSCTIRGTRDWIRALAASGWYTHSELTRWVAGFARQRVRYRAATLRHELRALLGGGR
jgi:lipopolysaccharide biosynthesis glycosyltransferase